MDTTAQIRDLSTKARTFAKSRTFLTATGGLMFCAAAMIFTNPGKPAYVDYASERLFQEIKQTCGELKGDFRLGNFRDGSLFALPNSDICNSVLGSADLVSRWAVKIFIKESSTHKNFGFFSIYTTPAPGGTFRAVGIGRNFILF